MMTTKKQNGRTIQKNVSNNALSHYGARAYTGKLTLSYDVCMSGRNTIGSIQIAYESETAEVFTEKYDYE